MEYANKRTREIRFFSEKNNCIMIVHTESARAYAESLEWNTDVKSYQTCQLLDKDKYFHIPKVGMRTEIFRKEWISDFVIHMKNDAIAVRELCYREDFLKTMNLQKMEFSRRYWDGLGVSDWKIIMV